MSCWRNSCIGGKDEGRRRKDERNSATRPVLLQPSSFSLRFLLRFDRGDVFELAVLDLQDDDRLLGVVLGVDGDRAAGAGEVLGGGEGVADLRAVGRAGAV